MGLPVLRLSSSSTHAVTNTPAEPQAAFRSHSPVTTAFPVLTPGRLPHHPFRGLLSVHSHYGLHGRQVPYKTLYTRGFSRFVTSTAAPVATGRSESCRTGFAPAERQSLGTAHIKLGLETSAMFPGHFHPTACLNGTKGVGNFYTSIRFRCSLTLRALLNQLHRWMEEPRNETCMDIRARRLCVRAVQ